mmetsp:Transcript_36233/g.85878  ORF Transcript_36233/g.85878 Transcript_36233/m.85878 type:complete len:237 (+) Transcript_36233:152-862(+)
MESGSVGSLSSSTQEQAPAMETAGDEPKVLEEEENGGEADDVVDPDSLAEPSKDGISDLKDQFRRHYPFETKDYSTLRTASVPSAVANEEAKRQAFIGRAVSAPASYTPLDAEDLRMQAVRGIHMDIYLRRKSSTEGRDNFARLPSASLDGPLNESEKKQTIKMMQGLLRELPHRQDGAAALQHLEIACKELGMEGGRRSSLSMMSPEQRLPSQEEEEEEEELTLEGIIQDMQQDC